MSEKDEQAEAQWTKTAAIAATIQKQQQQQQSYETSSGHNNLVYGLAGLQHLHKTTSDIQTYTSGRFQAPPVHVSPNAAAIAAASIGAPSATSVPTLVHQPHISPNLILNTTPTTNVPVPSGFVAPPFPSHKHTAGLAVPATATVATTSVLQPNPFVVAANSNIAFAGATALGLEQFQRLNAQQQYEIGKLMNAMNASGQSVQTTGPSANVPQIAVQQPIQQQHSPAAPTQRHHAELPTSSSNNIGAINSSIAENVLNAISCSPATGQHHGRLQHAGVKMQPDDEKMRQIHQIIESSLDDFTKQQISQILERVSNLKPVEKLLLYLRLPGEAPEADPLRQPQNPLGTRSEINHTINWVRSHLEHDPQVSIPKQDVYNDYITYCERLNIKPLSTADFGKVMKQVFPGIRPRRLGTRGNSRYCYAAMRKTTKLLAPQLPELGVSGNETLPNACMTTLDGDSTEKPLSTLPSVADGDMESWKIIKNWAEKLLNIKVDSMRELATRIKTNANIVGATSKKYTAREPKEKRLQADMGPLKKRRKKKRKGSTSSESSCNQQQQDPNQANAYLTATTKATAGVGYQMSIQQPHSEDEQKLSMVEIKQEIMDSPNYKQQQHHVQHYPLLEMPPTTTSFLLAQQQQQQQQQQQVLPMNLATDSRTVLAKAPPSHQSAFGQVRPTLTAVKNLTSKIMEMSANPTTIIAPTAVQQQHQQQQQQQQMPTPLTIKDEVIDDYSTTNIFCKKVRKAQQTKGFWSNSPTTPNSVNLQPPIITTTAATPPPPSPSSSSAIPTTSSPVSNLGATMGPPAQMSNHTSISPSGSSLDAISTLNPIPKVASRNMLLLRAKQKQLAVGAAATTVAAEADADLPENLGLPRERVISICNMDKHELDDYFLPGEEENSEDQDTELLQYFQTGDAEEKRLNSLDAAEQNRNPTANLNIQTTTTAKTPITITTTTTTRAITTTSTTTAAIKLQQRQQQLSTPTTTTTIVSNFQSTNVAAVKTSTTTATTKTTTILLQSNATNQKTTNSTTTTTNAVGSASASLALMSQKHQQQQQHQKQQFALQKPTSNTNNNNNKRKITLSNICNNNNNKNHIFLPISPNINNTHANANNNFNSKYTNTSLSNGNGLLSSTANCFASPGVTTPRLRPRASLLMSKQQSLDFEDNDASSSDPMIGASRRRRSYAIPTSTTSASAPPSPSVFQQYQSISVQWPLSNSTSNTAGYNVNNNAALLADQNSLDLDLFGVATSATSTAATAYTQNSLPLATIAGTTNDFDQCQLLPLNETQRSQSVPLSQLQRIQSPTFNNRSTMDFQTNYSACTSVNQTPVPPEFNADSTPLYSENSNSQHSVHAVALQLTEAVSSALLDDVDVNAMLSSTDFSHKFNSIVQTNNNAAATTCSSTGSSSGYSSGSGACTTFGGVGVAVGTGGGGAIISRSVPSTPIPHQQQQNIFSSVGSSQFYGRRCDEIILTGGRSSMGGSIFGNGSTQATTASAYATRTAYDISKSMPTTPITTPCFRYSPTCDFNRDFLINGNTIDSITSSFGGADTLIMNANSDGGHVGAAINDDDGLGVDTLIDDSTPNDVEGIMVVSDILGNL